MRRRGHRFPLLLVGYGVRARRWYQVLRRSGRFTVVGAIDPDPVAHVRARVDGVAAWTSLADALDAAAARAAIVASPPEHHAAHAEACLAAGLGVLVEKPLALRLDAAERVALRAEELGVPVIVGQNFRFLPRERAVGRLLERGGLGRARVVSIESARQSGIAPAHVALLEHGPLWDLVVHHVDVLRGRWGTPSVVDCRLRSNDDALAAYELDLEWPDGLRVAYRHVEGAACPHYHEWLDAEHGTILVDGRWVRIRRPGRRARPVAVPRGSLPEHALLTLLADAMEHPLETPVSAAGNVGTVATVEAAVRSIEAARPIWTEELSVLGEAGRA